MISLILIAGESLQVGTITIAAHADSAIPGTAAPIDPSTVSLVVVDAADHRFAVVAGSMPGQFLVHLTAVPNTEYRLDGTVSGESVTARTTVPASFSIVTPSSDTILPSDGSETLAQLFVPYVFQSIAAAGFAYRVIGTNGQVELAASLRSGHGILVIPKGPIRRIALLAYDQAATGWLVTRTPHSNLSGAFGCFGSALVIRRHVNAP